MTIYLLVMLIGALLMARFTTGQEPRQGGDDASQD
jgi:hypothetical protein